jgi:hypothetical protein
MPTFNKLPFSGSTNGRGIQVSATATAGTLVHTAVSGTTNFDEVWLYAENSSATAVMLTVEFGGTNAATDTIEITIPGKSGLVLVCPGLFLNNGLAVRAFAGTTNVLSVFGYVNRVTA